MVFELDSPQAPDDAEESFRSPETDRAIRSIRNRISKHQQYLRGRDQRILLPIHQEAGQAQRPLPQLRATVGAGPDLLLLCER